MKLARLFLTLSPVFLFVTIDTALAVPTEWVSVTNPGNANDTTGYGAVNYEYRIGKYEVTIQQYADFLNAVAQSDPYSLYNENMATDLNIAGISRSGSSGAYTYSVLGPSGFAPLGANSPGNRPITYVSWFDAARFANWMQNGQGAGSTETGAYTLVGGQTSGTAPAKNPGATFYIPTENEWYKAAYYSPVLNSGSGGYYRRATQSNALPGNVIGNQANQANWFSAGLSVTQQSSYSASQNYLTEVGAFNNSASYYGTFDQGGSLDEMNDLDGTGGSLRGLRGGSWGSQTGSDMSSSFRLFGDRSNEDRLVGFRLASPVAVPEPSTYAMALGGLACGEFLMWRGRRKRVA